ncbi:MAG: MFS transporter [Methanocellales archaeon]
MLNPLLAACAVVFCTQLGTFMRIPVIPLFAEQLGASIADIGFISSSFTLIACFLAIPLGLSSDRFGRKRLIVSGALISSAVSFLLFLTSTPAEIMLVYSIAGIGIASFTPSIIAFIGDITRTGYLGRSYGLFTTFMQIGIAAGPALGGFIASGVGYRNSFLFSGSVILFAAIVGEILLPSPEVRFTAMKKDLNRDFAELRSNLSIVAGWLGIFCLFFANSVIAFLPIYANKIGISILAIGLILASQAAGNGIARLPFGWLSDKTGRRVPFILLGLTTTSLSAALLASYADPYIILVLSFSLGLGVGTTAMATSAMLGELVSTGNRGFAMGVYSTCFYGGMAAGPAIIGLIIARSDFPTGFQSAALAGLSGAVGVYILSAQAQRKN